MSGSLCTHTNHTQWQNESLNPLAGCVWVCVWSTVLYECVWSTGCVWLLSAFASLWATKQIWVYREHYAWLTWSRTSIQCLFTSRGIYSSCLFIVLTVANCIFLYYISLNFSFPSCISIAIGPCWDKRPSANVRDARRESARMIILIVQTFVLLLLSSGKLRWETRWLGWDCFSIPHCARVSRESRLAG